jgi:hypothetical protein
MTGMDEHGLGGEFVLHGAAEAGGGKIHRQYPAEG